ncbi:MAG: IS21 family transposase [Acidobacteria bacterium]|nr:IS21 family transposase [Acidobacteriota bacterium]
MVMDAERINTIYRLYHEEKWSLRRISRELHMARKSIKKYLRSPGACRLARKPRKTKLDPFKPVIREFAERDPKASAVVIAQRLEPLGYTGRLSILRVYLKTLRHAIRPTRAFVRVESSPGDCFQVDWGHFGVLDYEGDKRKLYAFCLIECHSRRLYLEYTHSQTFETFVRCHLHAFRFMGGVARECLYDNLASAVAERDGRIVRFNPRFLAFARESHFYPRACTKGAGWEKGKVERGGIRYVRQNFWPLRGFKDLADVNRQAREWTENIANKRPHSETGEQPDVRFRADALQPLPELDPDYRDTILVRVHKDIRVRFDCNRYCVPARYAGRRLTLKADSSSVTIYDGEHELVRYARCWRRGQTFGAERFEKELLQERPGAERTKAQQRLVAFLGEAAESYLRGLATTDRSLTRQIRELLALIRHYGPGAVAAAVAKAQAASAFGADYIANILLQDSHPRRQQPPLQLRDPLLNELATDPLSLLEYDAFILSERNEP